MLATIMQSFFLTKEKQHFGAKCTGRALASLALPSIPSNMLLRWILQAWQPARAKEKDGLIGKLDEAI